MVTARLLTNCSNTLRNIHTNARENTTRTRAKRKAGYFSVAHPVLLRNKYDRYGNIKVCKIHYAHKKKNSDDKQQTEVLQGNKHSSQYRKPVHHMT